MLDRVAELKFLSSDSLASEADKSNYNSEFVDLQSQLFQMTEESFLDVKLFDQNTSSTLESGGQKLVINTGQDGFIISSLEIEQLPLLSALSFEIDGSLAVQTSAAAWSDANIGGDNDSNDPGTYSFAVNNGISLTLGSISEEAIYLVLENMGRLRALNGNFTSSYSYIEEIGKVPELVASNTSNAEAFLQTQDNLLSSVGSLISRIAELKSFSNDFLKSDEDIASYNLEFSNRPRFSF